MTITEALADLKTIQKRIEKKREYIGQFLARQEGLKDPLLKDGGSPEVIKRERQAITDLEARIVALRTAIQRSNHATTITVEGITRTVAEWLTWRKEVANDSRDFINRLRQSVDSARRQAQAKGLQVVSATAQPSNPTDLIVNVDEAALAHEAEQIETILGTLDGQLSLKNATVVLEQ